MASLIRRFFPTSFVVLLILAGCGEEFVDVPPFEKAEENTTLDAKNFVSLAHTAEIIDGNPVFPFSYQIFDESFEGYLAKSQEKIYSIELGENFDQRVPFLDFALVPGDTLHKFTPRRYHIIIDKRLGPEGEDVFFVLRRTRRGISDLEERQIWVVSAISGIMAVAKYQIDPFNGSVTLEMIGDSEWFRDSNLTRRIKLYDYTRTIYMDRDRSLLYEFNKIGGFIRVRDVKAREEIFRYDFSNKGLRNLVNFSLRPEVSGVTLQAEDSCYRFSESLQLVSSGICRD